MGLSRSVFKYTSGARDESSSFNLGESHGPGLHVYIYVFCIIIYIYIYVNWVSIRPGSRSFIPVQLRFGSSIQFWYGYTYDQFNLVLVRFIFCEKCETPNAGIELALRFIIKRIFKICKSDCSRFSKPLQCFQIPDSMI